MDAETLTGRLALAVIPVVVSVVLGGLALRLRRPWGHELERLSDLWAKAPTGEAKEFYEAETTKAIERQRDAPYRLAKWVLLFTALYAVYGVLLPRAGFDRGAFVVAVAKGFDRGSHGLFGPLPDWALVLIALVTLFIELILILFVLASIVIVVPRWVRWFNALTRSEKFPVVWTVFWSVVLVLLLVRAFRAG